MRAALLCLILSTAVKSVTGQYAFDDLPEGKYGVFLLDKVSSVKLDSISYYNRDASDSMYYAELKFGRNTFDLILHETKTGKVIWGTFRLSKSTDFVLDKVKSGLTSSEYRFKETNGDVVREYKVTLMEGLGRSILVSFYEFYKSTGKIKTAVIGNGSF